MPALRYRCGGGGGDAGGAEAARRCWLEAHHPNLEVFDTCFPTGISMSDIDGCVERHSHFLWIEQKVCGRPVPVGQYRMLKALVRRMAGFGTVAVIWAPPDFSGDIDWLLLQYATGSTTEPTDLDGLRAFVRRWYAAVEAAGPTRPVTEWLGGPDE